MKLTEVIEILMDLNQLKRQVSAAIAKNDANEINAAGRAFDRQCDRAPWGLMAATLLDLQRGKKP